MRGSRTHGKPVGQILSVEFGVRVDTEYSRPIREEDKEEEAYRESSKLGLRLERVKSSRIVTDDAGITS